LPTYFGVVTPQATLINSIRPQTYGTLSLGGNIGFNESILNSFQYHHFRMLQELLKTDFMQSQR
jgi:hypothetical protein